MGEKPSRVIKNWHIWLVFVVAAASLLVGIYLYSRPGKEDVSQRTARPAPGKADVHRVIDAEKKPPEAYQPANQVGPPPQTEPRRPRIAIIIDDVGYDLGAARRFIEMELPLSFAVLPHTTYSESIARLAHENGREVILHLPMEPHDYPEADPGPGALLARMAPQELIETLEGDLASVPHAIGINNHMGSRLTADIRAMETVMKYLKEHDLFFVDSLTAPDTVAYSVAKGMGLKSARRTMFLDNIEEAQVVAENIMLLAHKARKVDGLIGIAHPHPATYDALQQTLPRLREDGIRIVPISALVK